MCQHLVTQPNNVMHIGLGKHRACSNAGVKAKPKKPKKTKEPIFQEPWALRPEAQGSWNIVFCFFCFFVFLGLALAPAFENVRCCQQGTIDAFFFCGPYPMINEWAGHELSSIQRGGWAPEHSEVRMEKLRIVKIQCIGKPLWNRCIGFCKILWGTKNETKTT